MSGMTGMIDIRASDPAPLNCPAPVIHAGAQGIKRVAVDDTTAALTVELYKQIANPATAYELNVRSYSLTGGARPFPRILAAELNPPAPPPPPTNYLVRLTPTAH